MTSIHPATETELPSVYEVFYQNATAIVLAAVYWATQRSTEIHIDVPGPHPCLATVLERGFHIKSFNTFVCSANSLFLDARCYIPCGGDMY